MDIYKKIKKILNQSRTRYLVVGGLNTLFGYFCGIFLYYFLIKKIDIFFILIITSIVSITFSFLTYKILVFKTPRNWLKEYVKCYLVYGSVSVVGIFLTWLFLDIFKINIWIAQALSILGTVLFSYYGHKKFTFNTNDE